MDDYAVLKELAARTETEIPVPLRDLDQKENRHDKVCTPEEMAGCITAFLDK